MITLTKVKQRHGTCLKLRAISFTFLTKLGSAEKARVYPTIEENLPLYCKK